MHADNNTVICLGTVIHEWAEVHTQVISAEEEQSALSFIHILSYPL